MIVLPQDFFFSIACLVLKKSSSDHRTYIEKCQYWNHFKMINMNLYRLKLDSPSRERVLRTKFSYKIAICQLKSGCSHLTCGKVKQVSEPHQGVAHVWFNNLFWAWKNVKNFIRRTWHYTALTNVVASNGTNKFITKFSKIALAIAPGKNCSTYAFVVNSKKRETFRKTRTQTRKKQTRASEYHTKKIYFNLKNALFEV